MNLENNGPNNERIELNQRIAINTIWKGGSILF